MKVIIQKRRMKMKVILKTILLVIVSLIFSVATFADTKVSHYHPKGKMPSKFTIELQNGLRKSLPFENKRDFEEAKKGFIAAPPYKQIMAEAGHVAWDIASYEFLLTDKEYDSIHPSLQH
jgi:alkyl sulfatase BDS1-like metallo-beta-lactamase superfamily hydrolase